jgi:hypothetical protein
MDSKEMIELRKIRDANSARHIKMSFEELQKEEKDILLRYEKLLDKLGIV